jgi:hypothetical protein
MDTKTKAERLYKDLLGPVNARLAAMAYASAWRERCDEVQREALRLCCVKYGPRRAELDGQPITEPKHAWMMAESDWKDYYSEVDAVYRKRGWIGKDEEFGVCPALKAEELERQASRAVILAAEAHFPGVTVNTLLCSGLEKYNEYLRLLTALVVNHPHYRKPAIAC